jgi:hypothetical protein
MFTMNMTLPHISTQYLSSVREIPHRFDPVGKISNCITLLLVAAAVTAVPLNTAAEAAVVAGGLGRAETVRRHLVEGVLDGLDVDAVDSGVLADEGVLSDTDLHYWFLVTSSPDTSIPRIDTDSSTI